MRPVPMEDEAPAVVRWRVVVAEDVGEVLAQGGIAQEERGWKRRRDAGCSQEDTSTVPLEHDETEDGDQWHDRVVARERQDRYGRAPWGDPSQSAIDREDCRQ